MNQVHIQVIGIEPAQRALDFTKNVVSRQTDIVRAGSDLAGYLRSNDDVIAFALQRPAKHNLGSPDIRAVVHQAVYICAIDQIDAAVNCHLDHSLGFRLIRLTPETQSEREPAYLHSC